MRLQLSLWADELSSAAAAVGLEGGSLDPFAVVTQMQTAGPPKKLGQTEVIQNTAAPDWTTILFIEDFELGKEVDIIISLFSGKTSLGSCIFDVNSILGAPGSSLAKTLKPGCNSVIVAHVEPATHSGVLTFRLRGIKLTNVEQHGVLSVSDPFFEIQRMRQTLSGTRVWDAVFRSAHIKNDLNPKWPIGAVEVSTLCGGDYDEKLRLVVYDYESSGQHVEMGSVVVTLNDLLAGVEETANAVEAWEVDTRKAFTLVRKGQDAGKIVVMSAKLSGVQAASSQSRSVSPINKPFSMSLSNPSEIGLATESQELVPEASHPEPTFAAYVAGGCELKALVAIDMTASNGDPRKPTSLHHSQAAAEQPNPYEKGLVSLCSLLSNYDSDQKYPVWGFGAKLSRGDAVSQCFQIGPDAEVDQVDGILKVYRDFFHSGIIMSAPRDFSEVISKAGNDAQANLQKGQCYSILFIFTNGDPRDVTTTINALKETQNTPLSVVIVGVGDGPFSAIQQMERDLKSSVSRDMFRFVQFSAMANDSVQLRQGALEQIPNQLVSYFVSHQIYPKPPTAVGEVRVEPYNAAADVSVPMAINDAGEATVVGDVSEDKKRGWEQQILQAAGGGKNAKLIQQGITFLKKNPKILGQLKNTAKKFGIKIPF